jgi:hypothetical protein
MQSPNERLRSLKKASKHEQLESGINPTHDPQMKIED